MEWKNLYRGFLMGTSDLVPGVSGGTIAMILGIYDRLLKAISDLVQQGMEGPAPLFNSSAAWDTIRTDPVKQSLPILASTLF